VKVVVVGGGVIGLCAAHYLQERGAEVALVERDRCGGGTSLGNGGWITPMLSAPIAGPGVMWQAIKWMLQPSSPFYIRPRLDPALAAWCLRFWRNCSEDRYRAGMRAMLALGERTLELFDELAARGVRFEMGGGGLVFAAFSRAGLAGFATEFEQVRALGVDPAVRELGREELHALEPALDPRVTAGLIAERERWVRPESLCAGLLEQVRAAGAHVLEQTPVTAVRASGSGWTVETPAASIGCDRVLLAAGTWTPPLLAGLGLRIPLQPAKGYSITARGRGQAPRHALYFAESKVGVTAFEAGVRLSGTLELTGMDLSLTRRRVSAVARGATKYLRDWRPDDVQLEWAGLRPYLPDALPVIGPVPGARGAYVASGHGMSGVTLGPATGRAVAALVLEDAVPDVLRPFRLDRSF